MPTARCYDDPCGTARALDVIGERWALLTVRELLLGPKRFGQLREGLQAISPNVLSQRLHRAYGNRVSVVNAASEVIMSACTNGTPEGRR